VRALVAGGVGLDHRADVLPERRLPGLHLRQPAVAHDDLRPLRLPALGRNEMVRTSPLRKRRPISWTAAPKAKSICRRVEGSVSGEFEHLDRLLRQLLQVLEAPGDDGGEAAEQSWRRLDLLYESMGAEALEAMLRRQGMDRSSIEDAVAVMTRRRRLMS